MLVLSRREDESILIGNDIRITVVEMCSNHVKLGIDAPNYIQISRSGMKKRKYRTAKENAQ